MPDRHREAWTDEDKATLRRGFARKQPSHLIARDLGRTQEAVRRKAVQLGLTEPQRRRAGRTAAPRHWPGTLYRVTVFGEPRGEWRETPEAAKQDAIVAGLASWDESQRQWFLAVPVEIEWREPPP